MTDTTVRDQVMANWQALRTGGVTARVLVEFHATHKYLLMAHGTPYYQAAGRLLADLSARNLDGIADEYAAVLARALASPPTRGGHVNVLQHIAGYFRGRATADERQRLQLQIDAYGAGRVALSEPLALVRELLREYPDAYLERQVYLSPSFLFAPDADA